jgi:protein TonB
VTEIEVVLTSSRPQRVPPKPPETGVTPPVPITRVEAEYTLEAHAAKYSGSVQVSLVVDQQGVPRDLKVVRAAGFGLDEKALEAVRKWTFRPGMKNGKPVAVPAVVEVRFEFR